MKLLKTIFDYFDYKISYPKNLVHDPIPYGVLYKYVSSTYLNGFINHVKPVAVFQLDRYSPEDEIITFGNDKKEYTKSELREHIKNATLDTYHTKLNIFKDDIIILGQIEIDSENLNLFVYFYFDYDTSDCCIGKFMTSDSNNDVIFSIYNYLEEEKERNELHSIKPNFDSGIISYTELPLNFLKGWLSF